jgi:hypothetical protein
MNYKRIYDQIIDRAKNRDLIGYREKHHIIPICIGGSNSKQNIVELTAREHFICHLILHKLNPENSKLFYAFSMMLINSKNQNRYVPNSRMYEYLNIRKGELLSLRNKAKIGKNNPMWNKTGDRHHRSKKIDQYTKDGIFIKTWSGLREASRELNIPQSSISYACSGKLKTAGKFKWKYAIL